LVILGFPVLYTTALLVGARPLRSWFGARPGSTFGPYVLERSIGKGGMAEVFLARHDILKRPTAVKILSNSDPDAATVARFEREARLACRLAHPNTIQIFDYGETPEGKLYYAMEYVRGLNLAQLLSLEPRTPVARAIYMLRQIAGSLEEAHSLGLVHRDLKPSNIMVCEKGGLFGIVKVLDFGIATSFSTGSEDFTKSVELMGTPAYMAPERIRTPQRQDPRSDIYSFGAVAFHLLTGRNLFEGPGPTELIYQVMSADRPSPSQLRGEALPAALEKLVLDCLQINPEARPSDFGKILDILDQIKVPEPWTREKSREWWEENRRRLAAFL
jgi:serine/threonine-protein kinase